MKGIDIAEVLAALRSPWQNAFVERVIGTIRREVLDHIIVLYERHLRRRLRSYFRYYHASRTHLALDKDAPEPRAVEPSWVAETPDRVLANDRRQPERWFDAGDTFFQV